MIVDPNTDIGMQPHFVLCQQGHLERKGAPPFPEEDLGSPEGPFLLWLRSLDPNRTFLIALIPDRADEGVFFRAREIAASCGIHMQAPVETSGVLRARWEAYLRVEEISGPAPSPPSFRDETESDPVPPSI